MSLRTFQYCVREATKSAAARIATLTQLENCSKPYTNPPRANPVPTRTQVLRRRLMVQPVALSHCTWPATTAPISAAVCGASKRSSTPNVAMATGYWLMQPMQT